MMRGVSAAAMTGMSVVLAIGLGGCSTGEATGNGGSFQPSSGTVAVNLAGHYAKKEQLGSCDDIANVTLTGKDATLKDADGSIVAVVALKDDGADISSWDDQEFPGGFQTITEGTCRWSIDFPAMDTDSEFFTLSVGGVAGSVDFSRSELDAGIQLTVPAGRP